MEWKQSSVWWTRTWKKRLMWRAVWIGYNLHHRDLKNPQRTAMNEMRFFSLSLVSGIVLCCVYCVMCWCGPFTRSSLFFSLLAARILHIPTSILGASDRSKQIVFHPLQSTLFLLPGYKAIPQLDDWNAVTNIIISMMSNNDDKLLNKFP